jgi:bacillithiol system protein YtxJ
MNWISLTQLSQLDELDSLSKHTPAVIFKHSTRCSISSMAKARLEREPPPENVTFYYLDLLKNRELSNAIATKYAVHHESPQVLLISEGNCVYEESHNGIAMAEIAEQCSAIC